MRVDWDVLAAVAAGGALGAAARSGLSAAWPASPGGFPWVTLLVNLAGCAALGMVLELLARLTEPPRLVRPFLATGLLGGFTTFSAYALETRSLLAAGRTGLAAGYLAGTLAGALVAVWLGMLGVRLTGRRGG